jgi:hypothetical protein
MAESIVIVEQVLKISEYLYSVHKIMGAEKFMKNEIKMEERKRKSRFDGGGGGDGGRGSYIVICAIRCEREG